MSDHRLVTIVGATGAQGSGIVRALIATNKYKIRGLTRDSTSEKAQSLKRLSDNIEMVTCDINNRDDVERAFKDSWAIFALTDFGLNLIKPEVEMQQGMLMADVAGSLIQSPYYIFSTLENVEQLSGGKYNVPHFTQKAKVKDYIKEKYPALKNIFVEPGFYINNWQTFLKTTKSDDGTVVFSAPIDQKTKLHLFDTDDMGAIVKEILNDPEKFIGQDICICGEALAFEDVSKVFTNVTGIPAISNTVTEQQFRSQLAQVPKFIQDELVDMFQWFQHYGYYGKDKDWTNGQKLTKLTTFQQWLTKTGWKAN